MKNIYILCLDDRNYNFNVIEERRMFKVENRDNNKRFDWERKDWGILRKNEKIEERWENMVV